MALKPSYKAPNYDLAWAQSFSDAMMNNGGVAVAAEAGSGDTMLPRLTNGQVVALARAWRNAAARSKSPTWAQWYELTIAGLGWRAEGDRFVMTREHANAVAPPELLAYFWASTKALAQQLDATQTVVRPLNVSYAWDQYEQAARDAWHVMKVERRARSTADTPATSPAPAISPAAPAKPAESSGWGGGLLLLVLLLAVGATRKKGR